MKARGTALPSGRHGMGVAARVGERPKNVRPMPSALVPAGDTLARRWFLGLWLRRDEGDESIEVDGAALLVQA
jgi:hypothetical protein